MLKSFPKISHLGTKYVSTIFDEDVEITEKIDGSQFCFGKVEGEVVMRSKGAEIFPDNPPKMFSKAVDVVLNLDLPEGIAFYGEYLSKPKHNILAYERVPKNHIALFGVLDIARDTMFNLRMGLAEWADKFGLGVVPLLYSGPADADLAIKLLDHDSILGNTKIEGVVVKNYKDCFIADRVYPIMAAKYVSERFKEVHSKSWSKTHTGKGKWETLIDNYRTEARWQKAVQHLRDNDTLLCEPKDIGGLIAEVQRDIEEEEMDKIKTFLWREFGSELLRRSTAGLPEWYKEQLARGKI